MFRSHVRPDRVEWCTAYPVGDGNTQPTASARVTRALSSTSSARPDSGPRCSRPSFVDPAGTVHAVRSLSISSLRTLHTAPNHQADAWVRGATPPLPRRVAELASGFWTAVCFGTAAITAPLGDVHAQVLVDGSLHDRADWFEHALGGEHAKSPISTGPKRKSTNSRLRNVAEISGSRVWEGVHRSGGPKH